MGLLIFYFLFVLSVSFFCSLLESVILSVNESFIRQLQGQKAKAGDMLYALKSEIDRPLAAILSLNTISNTLGAALIGATVMKLYGNEWVALTSGCLTFCILIFSEIIPKTIGALYWKKLAIPATYFIKYLIFLLYPLVKLCEFIADLTAFGKHPPLFTRDELIATAEISQEEGAIQHKERDVIKNLLRLNKIFVKDIMTPKSVIVALSADFSVRQIVKKYPSMPFSRIPIYKSGMDDIIGLVLRYELLETYAQASGKTLLGEICHSVHTVSEAQSVATTMDEFIKKKEHIFIVVNGKGQTTGLVTLEDVIETLLGVEIVDEFDSVEDMRQFALKQSQKRGHKRRTSRVVSSLLQEISLMKDQL